LLDCVADYDDGDLTGRFVQEAGEVVCCEKRRKGKIPGDVEGENKAGRRGKEGDSWTSDGEIPLESIECVGSEALGLSNTSYWALSETTSSAPAFKFFVTS
jgi:hypothetical protein